MLQSLDALAKAKVPRWNQSSLNQQEGRNEQGDADNLDKHANLQGGGNKKLLYRRGSSFLRKSVVIVSGWRSKEMCLPYGCRRSAGTISLRSCGASGDAIRRRRRRPSSWRVTNARRPAAGVCSAAWSRAPAGAGWTPMPRGRGTRRLSALDGSLWTSPPVSVRGRGAEWVTWTRYVSSVSRRLALTRREERPRWVSRS